MTKCNWFNSSENTPEQPQKSCRYIPKTGFKTIPILSLCVLVAIGLTSDLGSMIVYGAEYSHVTTFAKNDCGNGFLATEINCANDQGTISGDHNVASSGGISPSGSASSAETNSDLDSVREQVPSDDQNPTVDNNDSDTAPGVNDSQPPGNPALIYDPTAIVLPCCDEMPSTV